MIKSMTMLLMIFSVAISCRSLDRQIICGQIKKHEIKPHQLCDISFSKNRCRCREFDFNKWKELSEPTNYPLSYCEGIAGFFIDPDIALDIRPQVRALNNLKGNLCE